METPGGSLVTQPNLVNQSEASEKPCLKRRERKKKGCLLSYTHTLEKG